MGSIRFFAAAVWVVLPLMMSSATAIAQSLTENKLKVALVYNFIMFADWPAHGPNDKSRLPVCVQKGGELANDLLQLDARLIRSRLLQIVPMTESADYAVCAVLVIDAADRSRLPQIRKKIDRKSVLTILDGEDVNNDGAMIAMSVLNGRMVFDVNTTIAQEAQLTISSKLLRLARKVQ